MGGTDNSTIGITIQVRDDGSIGLIDATTAKLHGLAAAGTSTSRSLQEMGGAGSQGFGTILNYSGTAGQGIAKFADESTRAMGGLQGGMRMVSGEAREMGLNMGYGLRRFLADSPAVMSTLHAMSGLFIGIAAVSIFEQLGESAVQFYEKWLDVNKAIEEYQVKAAVAADTKLFDTASLEETKALLDEIGGQLDELKQKREGVQEFNRQSGIPFAGFLGQMGGGFGGEYATGEAEPGTAVTAKTAQQEAEDQEHVDKLEEHARSEHQATVMKQLEGQAAVNSLIDQGYAKIDSHERDQIAGKNQYYAGMREQEANLIKIHNDAYRSREAAGENMTGQYLMAAPDPNAFIQQQSAAVVAIQNEASAHRVALSRSEQEQIITMQNAAVQAGMRGEALYDKQRQDALDALTRKYWNHFMNLQQWQAETAAVDQKFHNEKMTRLEEENYQLKRITEQAAGAGLTGVAKIRFDAAQEVQDLHENPNREDERDLLGATGIEKHDAATHATENADILKAQKQFEQEMTEIALRSDEAQEVGYAHIEAAAERSLERIKKDFATGYGQLDLADPAREAAFAAQQNAFTAVAQTTGRERVQMTERDNHEIAMMNSQTAQAFLPPWLAAQERIRDQYDETAMKAKADLDAQLAYFKAVSDRQHGLTDEQAAAQEQVWNQYYVRVTAEADRAAAEMEKQQEQTRDKIAGELTSLFQDPAKFMENRAKQLMADIVANWVMQLAEAKGPMGSAMQVLFGMNPEMSTSTNPKTALGSIFGSHTAAHGAAGAVDHGSTLSAASSSLSNASTSLSTAGSYLTSSGTGLMSAADALSFAADHISSMVSAGGYGGGGGGVGGGTSFSGVGGFGGGGDISGSTGTPGVMFGGSAGGGASAASLGTTSLGGLFTGGGTTAGLMSAAHGLPLGGALGGGVSLAETLGKGGVFGSGVQNFMHGGTTAGGGMNIPSMGVLGGGSTSTDTGNAMLSGSDVGASGDHVVMDEESGGDAVPSDSGVSGSGGGGVSAMGIAGAGMAALSGGMAMAQDWESGNTGGAVLTGAMTGASIGSLGGPIGMAIGAVAGALVGFIGSLFGDQGASKMRQYNEAQIVPGITKEMTSYTAAEVGYSQAIQDMTSMQDKASQQAVAWGSGAVGVFQQTVLPEINSAITEIERQQNADRSGAVQMSAAQYDSGGPITHFGDFSTGPFSGFIHARVGETMMNPMASMVHGRTLDAMNRGNLSPSGSGAGLGSSGRGGGGGTVQVVIQAWDGKDVDRWLRNGGSQTIQGHLNANAARYAGKALG